MKLVIFGLSVTSSWGNGHATLWRGLCRALHERGHRCVFFERDQPFYAGARDFVEQPGLSVRLYRSREDVWKQAAEELLDADAAVVTSFCADGRSASELVLASRANVRAFYDLDTPVTLATLQRERQVFYLPRHGLGDFDVVLSYTGGKALAALRDTLGARRVAALYGSASPDVHHPAPPRAEFAADLSYLGTYSEDRQGALTELLLAPASALPHRWFAMAGAQYPHDFPWQANLRFVRHLPPADHPAFFSSSRLTLNVTRAPMAAFGYCPSPRFFEAGACGTATISDVWEGIELFLEPGRETLLARNQQDVIEALNLPDEELRRIGARARERVLSEHTAAHRAVQLEEALFSSGARPSADAPREQTCSA
ncbi:MAG: glycosyltransferase [Myxococcales bacterium]|nr:MAG: glycosyltransferase [Myxococcales bacterium]